MLFLIRLSNKHSVYVVFFLHFLLLDILIISSHVRECFEHFITPLIRTGCKRTPLYLLLPLVEPVLSRPWSRGRPIWISCAGVRHSISRAQACCRLRERDDRLLRFRAENPHMGRSQTAVTWQCAPLSRSYDPCLVGSTLPSEQKPVTQHQLVGLLSCCCFFGRLLVKKKTKIKPPACDVLRHLGSRIKITC